MPKDNPSCREETLVYALEDMLKTAKGVSKLPDKETFKSQLVRIQSSIETYFDDELDRMTKDLEDQQSK